MAKKIKVDMTGVDKEIRKGAGRSSRVPEGEYIVKILEHDVREGRSADWIQWTTQIVRPAKYKGKKLRGGTSLSRDALFNLRNLIFAATGKNVAGKSLVFDPESIYSKLVGVSVSDNEYEDKNGNPRVTSQIDNWFPKEEAELDESEEDDEEDDEDEVEEDDEEDEEEEEKPRKKKDSKKRYAKKPAKKDDDEDEEEDDDDLEEVDVEEI